jgi:hypothetical protein
VRRLPGEDRTQRKSAEPMGKIGRKRKLKTQREKNENKGWKDWKDWKNWKDWKDWKAMEDKAFICVAKW